MEMLLMGLCVSMLGVAVAAVAFGAATREGDKPPEARPALQSAKAAEPARFFVTQVPVPAPHTQVPIDILLLQIENHVRLEHAAAQLFIDSPDAAALRSKTISPLAN